MYKKIIGIFVSTLLIVTTFPTVCSLNNKKLIDRVDSDNSHSSTQANWFEVQKLLASDGADSNYFGYSVSISGDYAIIGSHCDDSTRGSAYVFKRSGSSWSQEAKLVASDGAMGDFFGYSVSINGEYIAIGACEDDSTRGSTYVFVRSGTSWLQEAKLVASDGVGGDYFGFSVSINGNYTIIGAYQDDSARGSAYVFKRSGSSWSQEAKLVASDGSTEDYFGCSVSIDSDSVIIGALGDDLTSGSAYVFKCSGSSWSQEAKLVASDGSAEDYFSYSVSINGDYAIIGMPQDDSLRGSVYVFMRSGTSWSEVAKLVASDGVSFDYFGGSVSICGDYVVIGALGDNLVCGSAYVFMRSGTSWSEVAKLVASDGSMDDYFGYSVSVCGDYAIIGAPNDDSSRGSAYVFFRNQPPNPMGIDGPNHGKPGVEYTYCINLSDPNNDSLFVFWDWGDGINTGWVGPYGSGEEVCASHTWNKKGTYTISVTIKDEYGASITAYMEVTIPRNKAVDNSIQKFIEIHPLLFRIFQLLFKRLLV
jgi:hypothetical protein